MRISLACLLVLLVSWRARSDEIPLAVPADLELSAAARKRIRSGYPGARAAFARYLCSLAKKQSDLIADSPFAIQQEYARMLKEDNRYDTEVAKSLGQSAARNPAYYRHATYPRLSGRVLRVGPEETFSTFKAAVAVAKSGDVILLAAGQYTSVRPMDADRKLRLTDVAIVGAGPGKTTLFADELGGVRLLLANLHVAGVERREGVLRLDGGSMALRNCRISTPKGSYAFIGLYEHSVLLAESCVFERPVDDDHSCAFEGGLLSSVQARNCKFIGFERLARYQTLTLDKCRMQKKGKQPVIDGGGTAFVRGGNVQIADCRRVPLTITTEDPDFIAHLTGARKSAPAASLALRIAAHRNLGYWLGMLQHPAAEYRKLAASRISRLTGQSIPHHEPAALDAAALQRAVGQLDAPSARRRASAVETLLRVGEPARARLAALLLNGRLGQQLQARRVLMRLDAAKMIRFSKAAGSVRRWLEAHRGKLLWDQKAGRYLVAEKPRLQLSRAPLRLVLENMSSLTPATRQQIRGGLFREKTAFVRLLAALDRFDRSRQLGESWTRLLVLCQQMVKRLYTNKRADQLARRIWLNPAFLRNATYPRLSGRLLRVPSARFRSLAAALTAVKRGDRILLGEGDFTLDLKTLGKTQFKVDQVIGLRSLPYVIGMLTHDDAQARWLAAARLQALTGVGFRKQLVSTADRAAMEDAISNLGHRSFRIRSAAKKTLLDYGEVARERMEALAKSGSLQQRHGARSILLRLSGEGRIRVNWRMAHARAIRWYLANRKKLRWDKQKRQYVLIHR